MLQENQQLHAPALLAGIDIGSTTVKAVVLKSLSEDGIVFSTYVRHHAHQADCVIGVLGRMEDALMSANLSDLPLYVVLTGSGGKEIASALDVPFIQEVVANSLAVQTCYATARCAIELGGQDAKMVFFEPDLESGGLRVADMRMNGSCAGGTGAFLDEIATLLKTPVEELNALAEQGTTVHSISGRCGVYAKTDIQPLLNQGVTKQDIALSTFHAVAKQTIGGLAQGLDIIPPIIFEGGPLTFNPQLIRVFAERLNLTEADIIVPRSPETIVAFGAALSLAGMFAEEAEPVCISDLQQRLAAAKERLAESAGSAPVFFDTQEELRAFRERHRQAPLPAGAAAFAPGSVVRAYLGIDSGSTTTKFALVDEAGRLIDQFYASNEGEPLDIAKRALCALDQRYKQAGVELQILQTSTTGYGELMFARAFNADCHVVETVAHALAAAHYVDDATFILDIGGQDMKAIWISDGIITDILINEACSSGCGSFLETFAHTLDIPTERIADAAFSAKHPAQLGSRCTVFMNSSVVTEQKNGKQPADIMAGLCRSIIENVFTKVVRVPNLDALGSRIVVQGGTFCNDAVLAAFEQYVGRPVNRAPYPGLMGAIGAALFAMRARNAQKDQARPAHYLEEYANFSYTQESGVTCPFCQNACSRTVMTFGDGSTFVTGNRCERGSVVGDPRDAKVRAAVKAARAATARAANLYELRQKLLMHDYAAELCESSPSEQSARSTITIGIPRVLSFWDTMPFWTTFFRSLGFNVKVSPASTRALYENGLHAVASDTVCFPAKLVHGHVRALAQAGVSCIFMPVITTVPSENSASTSQSMCAVVKGYPLVMRNSDNPEKFADVSFEAPLFHWYSDADRQSQLTDYMTRAFGVPADETIRAIALAEQAQKRFRAQLLDAGRAVIQQVEREGSYAVVLASRPYHADPLVNHDLPKLFTAQGIAVLPPDAVPDATSIDLSRSRLDIVNNYHARMLSTAILSAEHPNLEYAQVVSFGCGHDAYLSDEIVRLTHAISDKSPLILKVDESDAAGPLGIRVRSFVEAVNVRRAERATAQPRSLKDPYPVKYTKADRRERVILVPNTSHAFSRLMAAVFSKQGARAVPLPLGRERAIELGKRYVHNDICFPAQIVIGEALAELETGKYDHCDVAVATGKYIGDCRLTHYAALLRKALDDAGYADVPIMTNDDADAHNMQPGFIMNTLSAARIAMALPMIDALEELLRKIRPYELVSGSANAAFERALDQVIDGILTRGISGAKDGFRRAISIMCTVEYDRSEPRPRVLIVGEYLLNFHPGANHDVEQYLEDNGFEIVEARMTDVLRKTYFYKNAQIKEYGIKKPFAESTSYALINAVFNHAHDVADRIAAAHPLYEPPCRMPELVQASDPIIHHTFDAGEGVLIPAEILHHAKHGCEAFLILQPFGCLPNHIVGRGISKRLKELYPKAQILPLDYDPDVSFANVENRLQMLVMNVRNARLHGEQLLAPEEVEERVAAVAADTDALIESIKKAVSDLWSLQDVAVSQDLANTVRAHMREALALEDQLRAQAKQALADAQAVVDSGVSNEVLPRVEAAAAELCDVVDSMIARTRQNMAFVSDMADRLSDSTGQAYTAAQVEMRSRLKETLSFLDGMSLKVAHIVK